MSKATVGWVLAAWVEPNAFDAGNIFGQVPPPTILPDFGPNFIFEPKT
jgi:hypothetical protein